MTDSRASAQFSAFGGADAAVAAAIPASRSRSSAEAEPRHGLEWFVSADGRALRALTPEWEQLARSVPERSIFSSPAWASRWWSQFGRTRTVHLAGARRSGQLVALAPLCTKRRWGATIREFLGSEEIDVGGILAAPGNEAVIRRLVRLVLEQDDWDLLDLWSVRAGSPTAAALAEALATHDVEHEAVQMALNPVLDLRADDWSATASRALLRDLARQRRVLRRQGTLALRFPTTDEEVDAALRKLRALHLRRWRSLGETSPLSIDNYWAWIRGFVLEAWRQGWLYFPSLMLDERLVATGVYLLYGRQLFYWIGAHEFAFARHSPNQLLMLAVIEDMRSSGAADVLDFGSGAEQYKLRWTQTSVPLLHVMAWRGVRGRAAHFWQGRVRPWAWAHHELTRPMRRWRTVRGLLSRQGTEAQTNGGGAHP